MKIWHLLAGKEWQVIFATDPANWTAVLQNQAPIVALVLLAFLAGNKKIWRFGHQYDETVQRLEAEIARRDTENAEIKRERDERIEGVRRDTEVEIARLKEERERERTRAERYETLVMRSVESNQEIARMIRDISPAVKRAE